MTDDARHQRAREKARLVFREMWTGDDGDPGESIFDEDWACIDARLIEEALLAFADAEQKREQEDCVTCGWPERMHGPQGGDTGSVVCTHYRKATP